MTLDKHIALQEYIKEYPQLHSWLYFNTVIEKDDTISLILDADTTVEQYIDGSKKKEYVFNVNMCQTYDTDTSSVNENAISETDNFISWILHKNDENNYPQWQNCTFEEIEVLTPIPMMTVDSDNRRALYVLQIKITYIEG